MKTKTNNCNIDLCEVTLIGPLITSGPRRGDGEGPSGSLGCYVYFKGNHNPHWLAMSDDKIDPYQLDDAKNAFARATAQANYNQLVEQWKAAD